jgi:hypothetical protein
MVLGLLVKIGHFSFADRVDILLGDSLSLVAFLLGKGKASTCRQSPGTPNLSSEGKRRLFLKDPNTSHKLPIF